MDVEIAKANIEHFEKLLETKIDDQKRSTVQLLLAEEKSKLAAALSRQSEAKNAGPTCGDVCAPTPLNATADT